MFCFVGGNLSTYDGKNKYIYIKIINNHKLLCLNKTFNCLWGAKVQWTQIFLSEGIKWNASQKYAFKFKIMYQDRWLVIGDGGSGSCSLIFGAPRHSSLRHRVESIFHPRRTKSLIVVAGHSKRWIVQYITGSKRNINTNGRWW